MKDQLDRILEKWNLLKHPFYQSWSAGTLPVDALKLYASEYSAFISLLAEGWMTLNDAETAQEEREHAELWDQFASALRTEVVPPQLVQTKELVAASHVLFAKPVTALGAMYAFEAQQPATATSKLDGLKRHYSLPVEVELYFEIHSKNAHEAEKLLSALSQLSPEEQIEAQAACEKMARSLWDELTGIQETACAN